MTFLAIACKARGIAYYTYTPGDNRNCGVTSSPERFAELERVAREVSALSPQLLMRDAMVQPEVRITEGPRTASFGFPSVKALMKENGLLIDIRAGKSKRRLDAYAKEKNGRGRWLVP